MTIFGLKQASYDLSKRVLTAERRSALKLQLVAARGNLLPGLRPLPDFLIIGAMRAGTSSLYKYLDSHPQTSASLRKEVAYFSLRYEDRDLTWYRCHFPLWPRGQAFEATPTYLSHALAPERMSQTIPAAKLVVLLREPIARASSQHEHRVSGGQENRTFLEAVGDELERGLNLGNLAWDDYLSFSLYGAHLQRWMVHYPSHLIGVFDSERLFRQPEACLDEIADFLGLPPGRFGSVNRNYSRPRGVPRCRETRPTLRDLPSAAQSAFKADSERLQSVLRALPEVSPQPRWIS